MVEVSPSKSQITVKSGWLFFTLIGIVLFPVLFYFVPNNGWNHSGIWGGLILALIVDIWYFDAPLVFLVLIGVIAAAVVLVKKYLF